MYLSVCLLPFNFGATYINIIWNEHQTPDYVTVTVTVTRIVPSNVPPEMSLSLRIVFVFVLVETFALKIVQGCFAHVFFILTLFLQVEN